MTKTPQHSSVTLAHIMGPNHANLYGGVHGGIIMKLVDDAAAAAAARHAGGPAVTASVDSLRFLAPAHVGDLLTFTATVANVGRTSLDVQVRVTASRWNETEAERNIVTAFLTFVAIDADSKPRQVPALHVSTPSERELQEQSRKRRAARM